MCVTLHSQLFESGPDIVIRQKMRNFAVLNIYINNLLK